jgi:hypothetical protein
VREHGRDPDPSNSPALPATRASRRRLHRPCKARKASTTRPPASSPAANDRVKGEAGGAGASLLLRRPGGTLGEAAALRTIQQRQRAKGCLCRPKRRAEQQGRDRPAHRQQQGARRSRARTCWVTKWGLPAARAEPGVVTRPQRRRSRVPANASGARAVVAGARPDLDVSVEKDEQASSRGQRLTAGSAGRCIGRAGRGGRQTRRPRADARFPRRSIRASAGTTRWSLDAKQPSPTAGPHLCCRPVRRDCSGAMRKRRTA